MDFSQPTVLGRTGLQVGRLGVAASYGAPSRAFEEAFEKGCNYFYWGSTRKSGPKDLSQMREALKAIDLGPLSEAEMERMKRIGDHVHQHGRMFF